MPAEQLSTSWKEIGAGVVVKVYGSGSNMSQVETYWLKPGAPIDQELLDLPDRDPSALPGLVNQLRGSVFEQNGFVARVVGELHTAIQRNNHEPEDG